MDEQTRTANEFFRQQGFVPANAESYSVFKEYEQCSVLQEMGATIIAAWSFKYNGLYKIVHGYLCSVYFYEGKSVYFAIHKPQGKAECGLQQIIDILYDLSHKAGLPFLQIKFIENRFLPEYEGITGYTVKTEFSDDDSEYAFKTKDILELSGTVNYNKRRRTKKFFDNEHVSVCPMTNENLKICFEIEEEWCKHKDCSFCESFSGCEKKALELMGCVFDDSVYTGLIGYYDDVPVGYIICEKRSKDVSFLYFGKANIQDYFVYLIHRVVQDYFTDVEYVNMNEDMGNMGLRMFKTNLGVYELWRKNICTYTKEEKG
ncbi:MAG: hypothetical protein Ta2A_18200 [Treponemataceae bacterium]|nr:MAG: hypothetical protein Ta2A_18200 [Treponemataceae bacterium]